MDCLLDYIGVSGCGSTESDSGLYINDVAGIQIQQINEIANAEQQNYVGVWAAIQKRALKIFEKDVRKAFMSKYKIKGVKQSINLGRKIDTAITRAQAAEYRGVTIELNEANEEFVYSNLQIINIQKINIYVPGAETFDLKIFDLDTEEELYTTEITTTAEGWKAVNINADFLHSRRIFVAYDCTGIDSVKLDLDKMNINCLYPCKSRLRGGYSSTSDGAVVTTDVNNSHGLSLIYSVNCKYDVVVCNNKAVFAQALLYLLASEFLLEVTTSSRLNKWTLLEAKQAKYLRGYYKAVYKGGVFEEETFTSELEDAVSLINLDKQDCCLECSGIITYREPYI